MTDLALKYDKATQSPERKTSSQRVWAQYPDLPTVSRYVDAPAKVRRIRSVLGTMVCAYVQYFIWSMCSPKTVSLCTHMYLSRLSTGHLLRAICRLCCARVDSRVCCLGPAGLHKRTPELVLQYLTLGSVFVPVRSKTCLSGKLIVGDSHSTSYCAVIAKGRVRAVEKGSFIGL